MTKFKFEKNSQKEKYWEILYRIGKSNKPLPADKIVKSLGNPKVNRDDYDKLKYLVKVDCLRTSPKKSVQTKIKKIRKEIEVENDRINDLNLKYWDLIRMTSAKIVTNRKIELQERIQDILQKQHQEYSLTFRGLIVYLYLENEKQNFSKEYDVIEFRKSVNHSAVTDDHKKRIKNKVVREIKNRNKRIEQVISNPLVNQECVFLKDYDYFHKLGFDVYETLIELSALFVKKIGVYTAFSEYDLDSKFTEPYDAYSILYKQVTEHYFFQVLNFLQRKSDSLFSNISCLYEDKSLNYLNHIFSIIKEFNTYEITTIGNLLESYDQNKNQIFTR